MKAYYGESHAMSVSTQLVVVYTLEQTHQLFLFCLESWPLIARNVDFRGGGRI